MKLTKREKISVAVGGAALLIVVVAVLMIDPAIERSKLLDRLIVQKANETREMRQLEKIYLAQKRAINSINKKLRSDKKNFAILSFLEETAKKSEIKGNIAKMKPSDATVGDLYKESSVVLKVDGITLNQLVDYLYRIENAERVLNVKRLKLKRKPKNPHILDVTFEVSTFELID